MSEPSDALYCALEAILMVADAPVSAAQLADALDTDEGDVTTALEHLAHEYAGRIPGTRARGFELRHAAGGWRIYSSSQWASMVGRFIVGSESSTLSQAALETLAVVAYRQPVTRARISHIRGVNVDSVVRTLVARGLIEEVGLAPSGARMYGTTDMFLERMGMNSLDELVPLAPYLPESDELDELAHDMEETL